jgi:predicted RNase H-like HicB family nuclease
MKLHAVIHEAGEGGYWAEVPALPGCVTQGETLPELERNLREAVEGWLLAAEPSEEPAEGRLLAIAV